MNLIYKKTVTIIIYYNILARIQTQLFKYSSNISLSFYIICQFQKSFIKSDLISLFYQYNFHMLKLYHNIYKNIMELTVFARNSSSVRWTFSKGVTRTKSLHHGQSRTLKNFRTLRCMQRTANCSTCIFKFINDINSKTYIFTY